MSGAFGLAGWHFSSNPTSSSSENKIGKADGTEPWKTGGNAAYQYHPHGDTSKPRKDAPSALNEVIIPNVNLPKVSENGMLEGHRESHDPVSRMGKIWLWKDQDKVLTIVTSRFTRSTTSGARRASKRSMRVSECCVNIKSFKGRIERFPCVHHRSFSISCHGHPELNCISAIESDCLSSILIEPQEMRRNSQNSSSCPNPGGANRLNQQV